ncbi:MAG: cytochrome C [Geobacter sp.]|nr:cytochrome C [Geobacter sp.]
MKKLVFAVAAVLAAAAVSYAASGTISGSAHDLSGTTYQSGSTDQICVFCHTPHNAERNIPLWNRVNPTAQTLYYSPTLSTEAKTATFEMDSISAFCMSCHDGVTKVGAIKNLPTNNAGVDTTYPDFGNTLGTNYAAIGNDGQSLKNDHPIGFSYSVAQTQDNVESGTGGLHTISEVKTSFGESGAYQPFYNSARGTDQMECASCHAVHQPGTSKNFLRIENGGSALCLACHAK